MIRLSTKNRPCMKKGDIIFIFVVLLLSTSLLSSNNTVGIEKGKMSETVPLAKTMPGKLRGKIAPDFILNSITGQKYKLSNTRGKVVLIDFWHTY